ncbi:AI-2E family transporter [Enterococcus innesii]|uniref:AI-2E family transporter n=1 Tax=Enterococcus innesii TaxID=2839759 RepID=UPI003B59D317
MKNKNKVIHLLGDKTALFILALLLGIGGVFLLFSKLTFLLEPIATTLKIISPPITMTLVLYFILKPIVNWLTQLGLSKVVSILLSLFALVSVFIACIVIAFPLLFQQFERLLENFPGYILDAEKVIEDLIQNTKYGTSINEGLEVFGEWINQVTNNAGKYFRDILFGATTLFSTITQGFLLALTVPIITFFLLKDDRKLITYFLGIFPPNKRREIKEIIRTIDNQVGAYLKGQLVVCLIIGSLTFVGFLFIGMPFSGTLAVLVGITAIVPYIGPVVAFFPCAIIALMTSTTMFLQLCIVWVIVQLLNGELIEPQVMGKHMVIHPVTIIFVLWVMGDLFGLFGLIFGIPLYAIGKILVIFLFRRFKKRYNRIHSEEKPYEKT